MGVITGFSVFDVLISKSFFDMIFQLLLYFSCDSFKIFTIALVICSQCLFSIGY